MLELHNKKGESEKTSLFDSFGGVKMEVVITGARGMLGSALVNVFKKKHKVHPLGREELNIGNLKECFAVLTEIKPQVVINAAAYTDVEGCQRRYKKAAIENVLGPRNLAMACNTLDCVLVHFSTDYVFSGEKREHYHEFDLTAPINAYGRTKLAGELAIRGTMEKYYIIRTSWLFGPGGSNFVEKILTKARHGEPIKVVEDQTGNPTYTHHLAQALVKLLALPTYGLYHLTNSGSCSWYQFALDILTQASLKAEVTPIKTRELSLLALRPPMSALTSIKWPILGFSPLPSYQEALKEYLA